MCVYFGSEIVLANLLFYRKDQNHVHMRDITHYCSILKQELNKVMGTNSDYMYFSVNPDSIDYAIDRYKLEFKKLNDAVYINESININYFNKRYTPEVAEALKSAAENLK